MFRLLTLSGLGVLVLGTPLAFWVDQRFIAPQRGLIFSAPDPNAFVAPPELPALFKKIMAQKLKPGTLAPPLLLERMDNPEPVTLTDLLEGKPIVLLFGSFT